MKIPSDFIEYLVTCTQTLKRTDKGYSSGVAEVARRQYKQFVGSVALPISVGYKYIIIIIHSAPSSNQTTFQLTPGFNNVSPFSNTYIRYLQIFHVTMPLTFNFIL